MSENSRHSRKHMWQIFLVAGIFLELVLIVVAVVSLVNGQEDIPAWQAMVFTAIAVWIYIAYLKQRAMDISKYVVDEKIKVHSLVQHLKEGLILLDARDQVLLMNARASEITGLDEMLEIGQDFGGKVDAAIAARLKSGEAGEVDGVVTSTGRNIRVSVLPLPADNEGARNRMVYVSRPVQAVEAARQNAEVEKYKIGPWLQEIVQVIRPWAEAMQVKLEVPTIEGQIRGNPALLREAMEQIVLAAVLASLPGGGTVRLRAMPMGGSVGVAVIDAGPAVPAASLGELFARPYLGVTDANGVKTRLVGGGLGRARTICMQQKGTVAASIHPEGGICVAVMLPG